jgi:CPA1 family monovalent cation:H+ antiporter
LKEVNVPHRLQMDMSGESLFNDGVGVALFTVLLAAASAGEGSFGVAKLATVIFREAVGGGVLGLIAGFVAYRAMRYVDDYTIEVLISLAIVTGTYVLATRLEVSGPIAVVVAGVILGSRGAEVAMSQQTQRYMFGFWRLVDDMLNSVLFLLIGLEVLVLQFDGGLLLLALATVPIVLLGRLIAVALPVKVLATRCSFDRGTIPMLTWGGVRGGISIALVLAIPDQEMRQPLAAATYMVAIFTILVQGMSLAWLARKIGVGKGSGKKEEA